MFGALGRKGVNRDVEERLKGTDMDYMIRNQG